MSLRDPSATNQHIGATPAVLDIRDLTIAYRQGQTWRAAVRDFSLCIDRGQTYGLVGESGSGKTTVALAIMRYLSENGRVERGQIFFKGEDLLQLPQSEMRRVWGKQLNLVPQDPLSSLNPSIRVGSQIAEGLQRHEKMSRREANERALELLDMVRIPDPARVARSYPHEISGGMQQRVLIAMALSTEPDLLVLDEPTTGLDVTTQAAILDLFRDLIRDRQMATLYVTHNLGVVAQICDRVAVLYAGELVEDAAAAVLFRKPLHPYTEGLLQSVPKLGQNKSSVQLQAIPGQIPALDERPPACIYAPRCPLAIDICHEERPPLEEPSPGRRVRCWRWPEIAAGEISARQAAETVTALSGNGTDGELLDVEDLRVYFKLKRPLLDVVARRPHEEVKAVDGISFELQKGQTLGIVGESGSGKTTLARTIVGLVPRTDGEIELTGVSLAPALSQRRLETLRMLQYVFQNPQEALNPYLTIGETLRRPLVSLLGLSREQADEEVSRLLEAVRLPRQYAQRLPGQLSGGEKQRVAIARAFATNPELLITDEPVSSLDVSVQASILNLLRDLQIEHENTLVFISHDLAVVGYLADQIAVMYVGRIMELAPADELFEPPYHPYTEALLSAIPLMDPEAEQKTIRLEGDVPSQVKVPSGCPFHPRCPRYLGDICREETPPWRTTEGGAHIFCHIPLAELKVLQQKAFKFHTEEG